MIVMTAFSSAEEDVAHSGSDLVLFHIRGRISVVRGYLISVVLHYLFTRAVRPLQISGQKHISVIIRKRKLCYLTQSRKSGLDDIGLDDNYMIIPLVHIQ